MPRRTLEDIPDYPEPDVLYERLMKSEGWPYQANRESYLLRDRTLFSLMYVGDLRVSEAIRLKKSQFHEHQDFGYIHVREILLSKRRPGKVKYRDAKLPLNGERAKFTKIVQEYLLTLNDDERLFPWSLREVEFVVGEYRTKDGEVKPRRAVRLVGTARAWQIIYALMPDITQHWLRAFGYNYDYDHMDHDLLAVADKTKADPRSIEKYIRRRHEKYPVT